MRHRYLILASVLGLALAVPASAQTSYSTTLTGLNEVPANPSPATGAATCVVNAAGTEVTISCSFQNLIGTYTASHLHGPATSVQNAGVQIGFVPPGAPWVFANGNHDGTLINHTVPITPAQIDMLANGTMYVNVHSTTIPGGEIRGQLALGPVPNDKTTWARVKKLYR
jgi:hypothetical protein